VPRRSTSYGDHITRSDDLPPAAATVGDVSTLARSFERYLRALNRSARTVETYMAAVRQLVAFLAARGMPTTATSLRREHVESYMEHVLARWKPATASVRYRALQQFFGSPSTCCGSRAGP
jgi:hypothetical protein